jgi:hypothetical protein
MESLQVTDHLAVVNLNGTGHYLQWGIIQISYANAIVILLMIAVFVLALVLPFPGHGNLPGSPGADPGRAETDATNDGGSRS